MRSAPANKAITTPQFPPGHLYTAAEYALIAPPTYGGGGSNPVDDSPECAKAQAAVDRARADYDKVDAAWRRAAFAVQDRLVSTGIWEGHGPTDGRRRSPEAAAMAGKAMDLGEARELAWDVVVRANVALKAAQRAANRAAGR